MQQYVTNQTCPLQVLVEGKVSRKVKSYSDNVMVVEVHFQNGAIGEDHQHEHEQISYCAEGAFDYSIEGKIFHLEKGDTIYVPKNLIHGCKLLSQKGMLIDIFTPYRKDFVE